MTRNIATSITPAEPVPLDGSSPVDGPHTHHKGELGALRAALTPSPSNGAKPQQNAFEVFIPRERLLSATREQEREMKAFAWALAQHGWTIQFEQDIMREGWWIRGWIGPRPLPTQAQRFREAG